MLNRPNEISHDMGPLVQFHVEWHVIHLQIEIGNISLGYHWIIRYFYLMQGSNLMHETQEHLSFSIELSLLHDAWWTWLGQISFKFFNRFWFNPPHYAFFGICFWRGLALINQNKNFYFFKTKRQYFTRWWLWKTEIWYQTKRQYFLIK